MEIRRLGPDDHGLAGEALRNVRETSSNRLLVSRESLGAWLAQSAHVFVVALDHSTPVGFCFGYLLDRFDETCMLLLYEIGVQRAYRRRGIGRRLVEEMKAVACKEGARKMWAVTETSNGPACQLYASTGAEEADASSTLFTWREPCP